MNYCMAIKSGSVSNAEMISTISLVIQVVGRILFEYLFKLNEVSQ